MGCKLGMDPRQVENCSDLTNQVIVGNGLFKTKRVKQPTLVVINPPHHRPTPPRIVSERRNHYPRGPSTTFATKSAITGLMQCSKPSPAAPSANGSAVSYQLFGETHVAFNATEAMMNILGDLAQYDDDFFAKLEEKVRGRTRNHVARSRPEVYPTRSDLTRYVKEIGSGWFNRRIVDVEREANLVDIEPQRSIDIPHRQYDNLD